MTIFSTDEFDELRGAFYRCNLRESVQPRSDSGRIIDDPDTYNRVQVLLNTPEMEEAHGFLYDIDFDHLNDGVVSKVNDLYELAIDKGFIEDERVRPIEQEPEFSYDPLTHDENPDEMEDEKAPFMKSSLDSAYTCLYTAMKDGQLKTGECFSNAKDTQSAKADAISKLANLGFTSIEIIAVEQGDTAARGEPNVANVGSAEDIYSNEETSDDETLITEADEDPAEEPAEDESSSDDDPLLSAAGEETSDESDSSSDEVEDEKSTSEEETEETPDETSSEEESSTEETVEEKPEENTEDEKEEEEPSETEDTPADDSESEKSEEDDSTKEKAEEADKYNDLFEEYTRIWKQTLKNMEKTSFQELTLKEKGNFYRQLGDKWTSETDPSEFMTPERTKTVEEITITI